MALVHDKFYVVVPKAATNLITNPSFELATIGTPWEKVGTGVTLAVSTAYQRRGAQSCEVTTATGVASGAYYAISLTSGTQYTFSVDVRDVSGQAFRVYFANSSGTLLGTATTWTGTGNWTRKAVTYTAASTATHRLYIIRDSVASTTKFQIDGAQLEVGAESTYLDGDCVGLTQQKDFGWNGTAHASTSYRLARTRAGGTLLDIETYAHVLSHVGLGRAPEEHTSSEINADGELWQAAKVTGRDFVIALAFSGDTDTVRRNRKALLAAMMLDKTPVRQPLVLRYVGVDATGEWATDPVDIVCTYRGGLENSATTYGAEKCAVQFRMSAPYPKLGGEASAQLGYATSVSNFANIGYRDTDGQWKAMGTGATGGQVTVLVKMPDGSIIAGGAFTGMGGVANTANLAKWNGSAWSSIGVVNGNVNAMTVGPDGSLYIGGTFLTAGGVTVNRLAKWDGSTWSALSTGMNNTVSGLVVGPDNSLYAGGKFTTAGGVAVSCIAKWDGANWTSLGTGMATGITELYVRDVAFGSDGYLYAVGDFTTAGGVTVNGVAKWTGAAWVALGTGVSGGFREVNTIAIGLDGAVYIGGGFNSAGGVTATNMAKWNGSAWENIGNSSAYVYCLYVNAAGVLFGTVGDVSGMTFPDHMATYFNGRWRPMDVNVNDVSAGIIAFLSLPDGRIYIGGLWTGTTATSATVATPNNTGSKAYPRITFTGPGRLWQARNYTNGDAIYFKNLTLLAGETAVLDCNPRRFSFTSSWRGNLQSYILQGSSNLSLEPGDNNVSAYMIGTTAASKVVMTWQPTFASIEEALR